MRAQEFAETLAHRLHAELDGLDVPARGWMAARPDLGRRIRRRRGRQALAAAAGITAVTVAAAVASAGSHDAVRRRSPPAAPARLRQLASRSFSGDPAPQPAAFLTYGAGQLFAVVYGQSQTPLLRLDPVTLRVTGELQAGQGLPPVYGAGALWVTGGPGATQLWQIDPGTLRVSRRIQVRAQITALAFSDGTLWLTDCAASTRSSRCQHSQQRLERIDPRSGKVTGSGSVPIASTPVNLAAGRVILVSGANSPVFAINPQTLAIRQTFHVNCDGCHAATGIAVGPDGLYAVSGSTVVRLNLTSGGVAAHGPQLPFSYLGALTAAPGSLWLATETGTFRLNPVTLAPTTHVIARNDSLTLTGDTEQALAAHGSVYVSYSGGLARYPATQSRP